MRLCVRAAHLVLRNSSRLSRSYSEHTEYEGGTHVYLWKEKIGAIITRLSNDSKGGDC